MTKLYAYTDELSGRDGEDKISFGHFYERMGYVVLVLMLRVTQMGWADRNVVVSLKIMNVCGLQVTAAAIIEYMAMIQNFVILQNAGRTPLAMTPSM